VLIDIDHNRPIDQGAAERKELVARPLADGT